MKKTIVFLLHPFLSDFRRFRRWAGGTWRKITDHSTEGGPTSSMTMWTRDMPDPDAIVEKEEIW
jgi:hypothetical protein